MSKKFKIIFLSIILVFALVACQDNTGDNEEMIDHLLPTNPGFTSNVTAHDPAILKGEDGIYYTFGSHFAVTQSTNLINWHQVASDGQANRLYDRNWQDVLVDAIDHVGPAQSTWAPVTVYLDGKYYMYYSLSTFGSDRSYIGRVESDNPTGPYDNSVLVISSPGGGGPNAIDPQIFYDKDGKLWMTYGSFFAGIYIIELHSTGENIGLPIKTNIGKKIWNGSDQGPEGPHIFYHSDTDYYYLMVSAGSLFDNYNMRVARSKNPDGPYVDIQGFMVESNSSGGLKLAGNFQFKNYPRGYAAMGHNSVLVEDGKIFNIFHSRYRQGATEVSGAHNQFVHQMFLNEDGWPVMAPNRYANESLVALTMNQAAGEYDVLIHTGGNSVGFATSNRYTFKSDGNIESDGDNVGTWEIKEDYFVNIKIGLNTYKGVVVPQWNHELNKAGLSFTAVSRSGLSLWANMA